jgi:hypothetical protein
MAQVMAAPTRRGKGKAAGKRAELPRAVLDLVKCAPGPAAAAAAARNRPQRDRSARDVSS